MNLDDIVSKECSGERVGSQEDFTALRATASGRLQQFARAAAMTAQQQSRDLRRAEREVRSRPVASCRPLKKQTFMKLALPP
jgi:hypothetical protein